MFEGTYTGYHHGQIHFKNLKHKSGKRIGDTSFDYKSDPGWVIGTVIKFNINLSH